MRKLIVAMAVVMFALSIHPVDAGWRRDRDRDWRERGPRCDVVRQLCRARHGIGFDYRRCMHRRGCSIVGF